MNTAARIDTRSRPNGEGLSSLGIFANTVHIPVAKPKPKKDKDTAQEQTKQARYQLQRAAQGLLPQERVAHCQRSTMSSAGVVVYRSSTGASFGNLSTCGSIWHCPICSARVTEHRRQELQTAISTWVKKNGEVYLMSLTFPHQVDQSLADNLKKFGEALKKFKNSRSYKNTILEAGGAGSIRALEVTHGMNGWHPHTHDLVFAATGQLAKLQDLQMSWIDTLIRTGLADRSQLNDMLKAAFDVQNGDYAAEYVAKFGHEATEASKELTHNHWGVSHELTKAHAKVGRRLGGRTPFTMLLDYIRGDKASGELFQEFGIQFKGKRQLFWSPKLRKMLALEEEKTDEQLAVEELPDREFVTVLDSKQWNLVLSRNARFEVLRIAQDMGAEGVVELLLDLETRWRTHQGVHNERGLDYQWHRLDGM